MSAAAILPKRRKAGLSIAVSLEHFSMPIPHCGCHVWLGCIQTFGYGQIRLAGKNYVAHRIAWEDAFGPVPHGMYVCHRCDVPSCINVDHLFLGTPADNMRDKETKRRGNHAFGSRQGAAKLTEADVLDIRSSKLSRYELAEMYGVSHATISSAINRVLWRHI